MVMVWVCFVCFTCCFGLVGMCVVDLRLGFVLMNLLLFTWLIVLFTLWIVLCCLQV